MKICKGYNDHICTNEVETKKQFCISCQKAKKAILCKNWLVNKKLKENGQETSKEV